MAKRNYPRTAALLGAQPVVTSRAHSGYRVAPGTSRTLRIPWRAVLPVVLLVAAALWLVLDPSWYVDVTRVHVNGSAVLETRRDVALAGQVLNLHGLWLRPSVIISQVLASVPVVVEADASCRIYPASCTIVVKEREPVLLWYTETGPQWVDAEGFVMPVRQERQDLPVISGPLPAGDAVPLSVLEGVQALQALELPGGALAYHPQRGILWYSTDGYSPQGLVVAFGEGTDMAARWDFLQRLLPQLRAQGIAPSAVDVRFTQAPVYKLSGAW